MIAQGNSLSRYNLVSAWWGNLQPSFIDVLTHVRAAAPWKQLVSFIGHQQLQRRAWFSFIFFYIAARLKTSQKKSLEVHVHPSCLNTLWRGENFSFVALQGTRLFTQGKKFEDIFTEDTDRLPQPEG